MKSSLVRTMFCEDCFNKHHPHNGDRFVAQDQRGLYVCNLDFNPPARNYGFTPHLIVEFTDRNEKVVIETFCLIEGCGVSIELKKDKSSYWINLAIKKYKALYPKDWIALQNFIDADYSLT